MTQADPYVLIVDDNHLVRDLLLEAFADAGYRVLEAEDGREAISLASLYVPAAVIMDIQMPILDGVVAARILRTDSALQAMAIIALSGMPPTDAADRFLFDGMLIKPVTPAEVLAETLRAIRMKQVTVTC